MANFSIVADTTCGLTIQEAESMGIRLIGLKVIFGNESYQETFELGAERFYGLLKASNIIPTTSQPSVGEFKKVYEAAFSESADILSIHISSELSKTVESARIAASEIEGSKISIIDSMTTAAGMTILIERAMKMRDSGASLKDAEDALNSLKKRMKTVLSVDTLEYLKKGGRIGGAQAMLGTVLKIKPILELVNGKIEPLDKARGNSKAYERICEYIEESCAGKPEIINICHADAIGKANEFKLALRNKFNDISDVQASMLSPVIGTHTGPGTIGIAFA